MTNVGTIDSRVLDILLRAGSSWVLYLLLGLSFAAVAVMLERLWFFVQERRPGEALDDALAALRSKGAAEALAKLKGLRSMEAAVARACLAHAADGPAAVEERKEGAIERERARYEKRLAFLGTLGNNAPFVGLLGTVLGVIRAFHDLGASAGQGPEVVMQGISEALVATAVGILVALPCVAAFNYIKKRIKDILVDADRFGHQLIAVLLLSKQGRRAGD